MVNDVILVRFTLPENLVVQINILDGIFFVSEKNLWS